MDSFQDGGQQNAKSERNEYPPMERSHVNAEVNNFTNSSGEVAGGPDNFPKLSDGIQPNAVQNYTGYNRSNYGMGDQHGGAMPSSVDYNNQNSQFSGQFSQTQMRSPYPGMPKSSMPPGRTGMMPSGMGMMPGSYNSQRMMSSNQSGPTPTLNQLLQTPNPGQRFQGNYSDFSSTQGKSGEMGSGPSYSLPQQGWNGNPRAVGPYPSSSMPGTYRNQGSSLGERSRSGMSPGPGPGYPHQGQYMGSTMAPNTPRYMMGQVRPSSMPPMSSHGYSQQMPSHNPMSYSPSMSNPTTSQLPSQQQQQQQQQMYHGQQQQPQPPGQPPLQPSPTPNQQPHHSLPPTSSSSSSSHRPPSSQGASPKQLSPAPPGMADQNSNHSTSSRKSEENTESNRENSHAEELKGEGGGGGGSENTPSGGAPSHLAVGGVRPVPSPAGSTGSRSDTPASNSGAQAGSPMPPRPPSSQLEGQGHTSQTPMATQGYSQQMMPPPMGGQMGYPGAAAGGKMGAAQGMTPAQMNPHYPQYSSQYPQAGSMRGQGVMGSMPGGPGASSGPMPVNSSYPQAMYNGPAQMGPGTSSMYNNMMNRSMPGYSSPYGPASGMPMSSHFGSFNSHMGPGQGPGPGPGPGSGPNPTPSAPVSVPGAPSSMMPGQMSANSMGQPGMGMQHGGPAMMPGGKGAQAAAQAALMAAANLAGMRMPSRGMAGSPRMMGPQSAGSPSPASMTAMPGNLGNPSLNSMSNQIQQITSSSVSLPGKPSSPANNAPHAASSSTGPMTNPPTFADKPVSCNNIGVPATGGGNEPARLMSPMSGSDTQESSRPSSTATPGQTVDASNNTSEVGGSDGSGSMPSSDSFSLDSGFHSAADQSEKAPSESTPTHSSSPSNSNPPLSANGQCEEGPSQASDCAKMVGSVAPSSIPTSVHSSTTTTTITSVGSSSPPSQTTSAGGEMLSSSCQTTSSLPMMMNSSTNCNNPPLPAAIPNGPHYPHAHPHPGMGGYPMGPQGPGGAMGGSHLMGGPGVHHPAMQHSMGTMAPYNMPQNNMPQNNMAPNNMPSNSMAPSNMPPSNMAPSNMAPSNMPPSNIAPSNMAPSNMAPNNMPSSNMAPNNMAPSNMPPSNMAPSNMAPNNMAPNNMPPNNMPPNNMPPSSGMSASMPSQTGMPSTMPPGGMMNNMPPHGVMPGNMPPVGMPQSGMPNSGMPNSMSRGSMANHMPPGSMPGNVPPGTNLSSNGKGHPMGPMGMPPQNNTAARASGPPDDPPEKKKKKASDVTKLYDMGSEMDRRPFLDKLLSFVEEKGTPITTMPNISKQPLDLYKLYHCVREKGGFVEVNKAKRWKEICTAVNIGCSASAAFTLKKNYIRYLFAFECKFDLGGVDPAPILAEMETHGDRKREKKRVPSPGSQSSQDAFQQGPGSNSQMMDGYHGGGGMPPPFMQGAEGQMMGGGMGGQGPGMMMPNNMMGHPNMMGPHHQGSGPGMLGHGPNAMMMGSGQNMMGGGMGPQGGMMNTSTSMMGPSGMMGPGMHMGSNSYGPGSSHGMMGAGAGSNSSLGPSPGPPMGGSAGGMVSSSPGPLPPTTTTTSVGTGSNNGVAPPPSSTPNSRPATADSVSVQDPFADEPGKVSSPATFQSRPGAPAPSPTPGGFPSPGPPTTSGTGYGSRPSSASNSSAVSFPNGPGGEAGPNTFRRSAEGFPPGSSGPFRADGAQYPFGQENSSHPGQPFHPPSAGSDTYAPRFPGQPAAFRASGPAEAYSGAHPYPGHTSGMGPRMPGQEGYGAFPSAQHPGVRPALARDGSYPAQGRDTDRWSPLHSQRSFPPGNAPGGAPMGPYGRPLRGSPQPRDKVLAAKLQKTCSMLPNTPFQPKKEIVFPPDCVEATQPTLTKRRRLTHKDICPVEAWRLMMALKSGLLAESTWAIDTLNILLFDDATVTYFNLSGLPGLLEVLTEHFRASLLQIFKNLRRQELQADEGCPPPRRHADEEGSDQEEEEEEDVTGLVQTHSEAHLDKAFYSADFTWVSRQGRGVVKDQKCGDGAVLDGKKWDRHCCFVSGRRHWQKGGGDITNHVVPCFESGQTRQFLTDMFYLNRTSRKEGARKRRAAADAERAMCGNGPKRLCGEECPSEKDRCEEGVISLHSAGDLCDHSKVCSQQVLHHQNNATPQTDSKGEEQGSSLHRCQSQNSLHPPVLSHSGDRDQASNEDGVKSRTGQAKENGDQSAPPELTSEGEDKAETKRNQAAAPEQPAGKETSEKQESDAKGQGSACKEEEDEMTAEIVAMMIREQDKEMEEEAYRPDEPPLTTVQSEQEEVGHRCVAISNIFRSLSCIPGNEAVLAKHHGLMWLLGQLLLLHHSHPVRCKPPPAPPLNQQEVVRLEEGGGGKGGATTHEGGEEEEKDWATCSEWWWETLEALRENALVILANICSHMHMRDMASEVCMPILDGLLHWMVCPSSAACDPLPSAPSSSQLSPQRLVLEALCKLCIHEENVDLVLATPPFSRILLLLERLIRLLAERSQPVPREFSIALLSRLVQGDAVAARAIALQHPSIPLLIEFLESAEQSAMAVAGQQGVGAGVQSSPEALGTSLDMLKRAASTLLLMARLPQNRKLFLHHQNRLLALVMSQWLDSGVTQVISDVLFECSQFDPLPT